MVLLHDVVIGEHSSMHAWRQDNECCVCVNISFVLVLQSKLKAQEDLLADVIQSYQELSSKYEQTLHVSSFAPVTNHPILEVVEVNSHAPHSVQDHGCTSRNSWGNLLANVLLFRCHAILGRQTL